LKRLENTSIQAHSALGALPKELNHHGENMKEEQRKDPLLKNLWQKVESKDDEYKGCVACQKIGKLRKRIAPLQPLPIIDTPFLIIAMDFVGPLPMTKQEKIYFLFSWNMLQNGQKLRLYQLLPVELQ